MQQQELGRVLKEARERMGIDLDELQTRTKIRKRYLIALEEGDWSPLPGDVYARGFVRSYAECVGLEGRELLEKYASTPGQQASAESKPSEPKTSPASPKPTTAPTAAARPMTPPKSERPVTQPRSQKRQRRNFGAVGQGAAVVAILAVLGGAWWMLRAPAGHAGNNGNGDVSAVGNQSGLSANVTNNAVTNTDNATGNAAGVAPSNNTDNSTNTAGKGVPASGTAQVAVQPFQGSTQTYVVTTSDKLSVTLTANNQLCWIQASTDGAVVDGNLTLQPGQTKTWTATQNVKFIIGKVPAVSLTINGQSVTLPGTNTVNVLVTKAQTH